MEEKGKRWSNDMKMYELILDEINEGVHVVNEHGESIIYNRKMEEIESMKKEDVLDKNVLEVFQFPTNEGSTLLQALHYGKITKNVKQIYFNDKKKEINTVNHTFPIIVDDRIVGAIEIANDVTKMERMIRANRLKTGSATYTFESIIGQSEAIQEVIKQAKRATRTSSSVLIIGETGTGKELFAQSIHHASFRSNAPLISQNCAALPEHLIEGLLFGTKKGAFTGAVERPGLFEQAEGGTLFLDEINSLSIPLQAKLLRALEEKTIRRIGDTRDKKVDVRFIAAMNEDPIDAISHGLLRKDLYYRLGVVMLIIPPLRNRKKDILCLTEHFIEEYNRLFQMDVRKLDEDVGQFFNTYDWPGNVRELQHSIEGAMNLIVNEKEITFSHLPVHLARRMSKIKDEPFVNQTIQLVEEKDETDKTHGTETKHLKTKLEEFERTYIQKVLAKNKGNISKTAKELGLSRQSLQYHLRKFKL